MSIIDSVKVVKRHWNGTQRYFDFAPGPIYQKEEDDQAIIRANQGIERKRLCPKEDHELFSPTVGFNLIFHLLHCSWASSGRDGPPEPSRLFHTGPSFNQPTSDGQIWFRLSAAAANNPTSLTNVTQTYTTYATAGNPFQALVSSSGTVLVSVSGNGNANKSTGVQVFKQSGETLQSSCVNKLPASLGGTGIMAIKLLSREGDIALAIEDSWPGLYHTADLMSCNSQASPFTVSQGSPDQSIGTFNVTITPDGKYAFVVNEYGYAPGATTKGNIGVVTIQRDTTGHFTSATKLIGQISTGHHRRPASERCLHRKRDAA
ncbi:MAG: hypothetical protein HQK58_01740 [Deltaproteobacteria bacterium]|nr:hypothetical protein [Deltaproteobacteria bacterium]